MRFKLQNSSCKFGFISENYSFRRILILNRLHTHKIINIGFYENVYGAKSMQKKAYTKLSGLTANNNYKLYEKNQKEL